MPDAIIREGDDAVTELAPKEQRIAIAGGLVTVGIAVATMMCLYPWRYDFFEFLENKKERVLKRILCVDMSTS